MDEVEKQALKDLADLFVQKELGPLMDDLVSKLGGTYAPLIKIMEQAAVPAIQQALQAQIDKL